MSNDKAIEVELTQDERSVLRCGVSEWGGPARCTPEMAVAIGFRNVDDLLVSGHQLWEALGRQEALSLRDWVRCLLATEVVFASNVLGSGWDWSITTGFSDERTIKILRSLQEKIPTGGRSAWRDWLAASDGQEPSSS